MGISGMTIDGSGLCSYVFVIGSVKPTDDGNGRRNKNGGDPDLDCGQHVADPENDILAARRDRQLSLRNVRLDVTGHVL